MARAVLESIRLLACVAFVVAVIVFGALSTGKAPAGLSGIDRASAHPILTTRTDADTNYSSGNISGPGSCGVACAPTAADYNNTSAYVLPAFQGNCTSSMHCLGPVLIQAPSTGRADSRPASWYSGCNGCDYKVGAAWAGANTTATVASTVVGTPSSGPRWNDQYSELLSAWDSNGHYDQIGLASDWCNYNNSGCEPSIDQWTVIFSVETLNGDYCWGGTYIADDAAAFLLPDTDYTFLMKLTGSQLQFVAWETANPAAFSYYENISDTATSLLVDSAEYGGGSPGCNPVYGFSVYEEVYDVSSNMSYPQWDSGFYDTMYSNTVVTNWGPAHTGYINNGDPTSPHGYELDLADGYSFVRIDNLAFWLGWTSDRPVVNPGGSAQISGSINADGDPGCNVNPCGFEWSCAFPSESVNPLGFQYTGSRSIPNSPTWYNFTVSSSATPWNPDEAECVLYTHSFTTVEWTTWIFYADIT